MGKNVNKLSSTCLTNTAFHANIGVIMGVSSQRATNLDGIYMKQLQEELSALNEELGKVVAREKKAETEEEKNKIKEEKEKALHDVQEKRKQIDDIRQSIYECNQLHHAGKPLTKALRAFAKDYAAILSNITEEGYEEQAKEDYVRDSGVLESNMDEADMYEYFKESFPSPKVRYELTGMFVSMVLRVLDSERKKFPDYSTEELILNYAATRGKGFMGIPEALSYICMDIVNARHTQLLKAKIKIKDEDEELYKKLTNIENKNPWISIMYMVRHTLLDATKIKIGDRVSYAKEIEEGDDDNEFEDDGSVHSAEEESPEHWSVRADTISSFASLSAEARSILYQALAVDNSTGKIQQGFLGFAIVTDVMDLHRNLMGLREAFLCHDSEEFMNVLRNTGTKAVNSAKAKNPKAKNSWQLDLYNTLLNNPKKRTAFFLCYRKIHLEYSAYRKKVKHGLASFYRMESGVEGEVRYNSYAAELLDIDENNHNCIFNQDGTVNSTNFNRFLESILGDKQGINNTYVPSLGVYTGNPFMPDVISENAASIKLDFIMAVNRYLNLHMSESSIDEIVNNQSNYLLFCKTLRNLANYLKRNVNERTCRAQTLFLGEDTAEVNKLKSVFKPFLTNVIKDIDKFSKNSPVETAYRYNKSTFYIHTVPNYLGDKLEEIAKAAAQGHSVYKKFLEDNYLSCPIFATKDGDTYIVHNLWLRKLYEEACDTSIVFDIDNGKDSTENTDYPRLTNQDTFTWQFTHNVSRGLGWENREFKRFSEKDNYLFDIQEYFGLLSTTQKVENVGNRNVVTDEGYAKVPLFVTGDSNSTRFITIKVLSVEDAMEQLYETAFHEFERIRMFEEFKDWCDRNGYSLNDGCSGGLRLDAQRFSFFDVFNKPEVKHALMTFYGIYESMTDPAAKENARKNLMNEIKKYVDLDVKQGYSKHCDELLKRNLITVDEGSASSIPFCSLNSKEIYISNWRDTNGRSMQATDKAGSPEMSKALYQYYLNTRVHLISQEQMFTIDPAFYMSTEDMQKRFKEVIAAGDCLDPKALDPSDPTKFIDRTGVQRVIYLSDIKEDIEKADPGFFALLKKVLGEASRHLGLYHKASLTDGQAYRSFSSYRKILVMRGIWNDDMEAVYKIIQNSRERYIAEHGTLDGHRLNERDLRMVHSLKVVFQPIKPFYYELESVELEGKHRKMMLPVQLKYSEYPIIPELLPLAENGRPTKLASLGYLLEDQGIDLAAFSTCVKVGGYGNIDIRGRNSYQDLKNAFEGKDNNGDTQVKKDERGNIIKDAEGNPIREQQPVIHNLPLKGYRIQSNIPEHFNSSRARGTQAIKHLLGAIFGNDEYKNYPFIQRLAERLYEETGSYKLVLCNGTDNSEEISIDLEKGLSRKDLLRLAETLGSVGFLKSTMKLLSEFKDVKSISKELTALVANDKRAPKNALSNYKIGSDGRFRISPSEGVAAADNVASLMSRARKDIIKQRMNGGSAVQVSAYGFEDVLRCHIDPNNPNVIHSDCAVPFDFSYTLVDEQGNETVVELDYFDYVDPNTGKLLDENGKAVEPGEGKSKLEKEFPGILDMVAYRIPTEKHYSMISLRAKRFFPKTCGGVIMVPTQFTVIAGFDFDIDKLYFFRKEYRFNLKNPKDIGNSKNKFSIDDAKRNLAIWTSWYTETDKGKAIFPWLIIAAAQFYHDNEKVLTDDIFNLIPIKDEIYEENGEPQTRKKITVPSEENLQKIQGELKKWMHTDAKNFDRMDYIDFYNEALNLMQENGIDISEYLSTKEEEFVQFVGSSGFRGKYCVPSYEWKTNKDIVDNSQTAVNNMLFELLKSRLEDVDTLTERLTPGGCYNFTNALPFMHAIKYADKEALKKIHNFEDIQRELVGKGYGPAYNPSELSTIAHYQTYNAEYDDMIGVTANISINLRLMALYEELLLKYTKESGLQGMRYLRVGSMLNAKDQNTGRNFKERMLNGQDTEINVTECLNGSVDAVKAAVLEFFGINLKSLPMVTVLLKLGASPIDIGMLFNQPVVLDALQRISESTTFLSFEEALKESLKQIVVKSGRSSEEIKEQLSKFRQNPSERENYLTLDSLSYCFNPNNRKTDSFVTTQYAIASFLAELDGVATEMSSQISISKDTSTNSVQSSVGNLQVLEQKVVAFHNTFGGKSSNFSAVVFKRDEIEETPEGEQTVTKSYSTVIDPNVRIDNNKNSIRYILSRFCDSPYCMEQSAYSSIMTFLDSVIGKCFPYRTEAFKKVAGVLALFTKRKFLDEDIFNAFNSDFTLYCLQHCIKEFMEDSQVEVYNSTTEEHETLDIPKKVFYDSFFEEYFRQVLAVNKAKAEKNPNVQLYTDIPIIAAWHREKRKIDGKEVSYLRMSSVGGQQGYQKDLLIDSWAQMLGSSDPVQVDLAYHLFWYSFYKSGFNISQYSCMHLTPLELKEMLANGEYRNFFERVFSLTTDEESSSEEGQEESPIPKMPSYVYYSGKEDHTEGQIQIPIKDFIKSFFMNTEFYQFKKVLGHNDSETLTKKINSRMGNQDVIEIDVTSSNLSEDSKELIDKLLSPIIGINEDGIPEVVGYEAIPCIVTNEGDIYICDNDIYSDSNVTFNTFKTDTIIKYYKMNKPVGNHDFSTPLAVVRGNKREVSNNEVYSQIDAVTGIMELLNQGQAFPKPGESENQLGGANAQSFNSADVLVNIASGLTEVLQNAGVEDEKIIQIQRLFTLLASLNQYSSFIKRLFEVAKDYGVESELSLIANKYPEFSSFMHSQSFRLVVISSEIANKMFDLIQKALAIEKKKKKELEKNFLTDLQTDLGLGKYEDMYKKIDAELSMLDFSFKPMDVSDIKEILLDILRMIVQALKEQSENKKAKGLNQMAEESEENYNNQGTPLC